MNAVARISGVAAGGDRRIQQFQGAAACAVANGSPIPRAGGWFRKSAWRSSPAKAVEVFSSRAGRLGMVRRLAVMSFRVSHRHVRHGQSPFSYRKILQGRHLGSTMYVKWWAASLPLCAQKQSTRRGNMCFRLNIGVLNPPAQC